MFILVPTQKYNRITGQEEDVTVSLVSLDIHSIATIDADLETGNAVINYKSGEVVTSLTPFTIIFTTLYNNNMIGLIDSPGCKKYFEPINVLLTQHNL